MKEIDWIVLAFVTAAFVLAFIRTKRRKNACSGDCASCGKKCR